MDGARLANAAAALGISLKEATRDAGVDVLSFGGTKNGMMFGEAVVVFTPELKEALPFVRKQSAQLASKMRFISAQFTAMLRDNLWRENAAHANAMARQLAERLQVTGIEPVRPVDSNAIFLRMAPAKVAKLREKHFFYTLDEAGSEVRLMTSFDTTESDIDQFVASVRDLGPV
jgi:threonine aldolase